MYKHFKTSQRLSKSKIKPFTAEVDRRVDFLFFDDLRPMYVICSVFPLSADPNQHGTRRRVVSRVLSKAGRVSYSGVV